MSEADVKVTMDEDGVLDVAITYQPVGYLVPACGAACPSGQWAGLTLCTLPAGHEGDHETWCERRPGAWDCWETWPQGQY
jgi:hypothetical protein